MTKFGELKSRAQRNIQPQLTTFDGGLELPTPVFTPSTLANLEEVFSYSQIPATVNSSAMHGDSSDFSEDDTSRTSEDYEPPSIKRAKGSTYATSSRSLSPDVDYLPLRRRRPMRADDDKLCKEDLARVMQRRNRNKEAAARCRQRRVDLIDKLKEECDSLEETNNGLESAIEQLRQQKEHLEFVLQVHQPVCKLPGSKPTVKLIATPTKSTPMRPNAMKTTSFQSVAEDKPISRPTSLLLSRTTAAKVDAPLPLVTPGTVAAAIGIPITTPSSLLSAGLTFDLLLDGHTGLTPVVPTLATPQLDVTTPSTIASILNFV